jgi:hypothetical protein
MPSIWNHMNNPDRYFSLGVAYHAFMYDELSKHIHNCFALLYGAFTYSDGMIGKERLKKAIRRFLSRYLKPILLLKLENIDVTNGCSSTIKCLSYEDDSNDTSGMESGHSPLSRSTPMAADSLTMVLS